jgi:hypothetical protein
LEEIRELKNVVVKTKYEAAKLRDDEKRIEKKLQLQEQWEEDAKTIELKLQRTTLLM